MDEVTLPVKLLIALALGGVIGLEREINEKKKLKSGQEPTAVVGIRSFALTAVLGALIGAMYSSYAVLAVLITAAFFILMIAYYVFDVLHSHDPGITTELALIYSFLFGVLVSTEVIPIQISLAVGIVLLLLLSKKDQIKDIVENIRRDEINAFISYLIVALVILPFLPNTTYSLSDIGVLRTVLENFNVNVQRLADIDLFNPFKIWLVVALITGIDILGYILERTLGQKRGWLLASIAGGFISSTATTQSIAQQSKTSKQVNHLVGAALLANLASFFQIALIIGAISALFLFRILPVLLSIILSAALLSYYFIKKKEKKETIVAVKTHEIFNLAPALKFAILYLTITAVSKIALEFFGESGFFITTAIGALAGLDAVMINTAQLAGNFINFKTAAFAFILANTVNLLAKSVYSYLQGSKEFALKLFLSFLLIIGTSLLGLFFV